MMRAVGHWVLHKSSLNSTILDNFAAAATDFTIFRNGSWIADITV